jgi:hypothetical protein
MKAKKNRLNKEGNESVTKCNRMKMESADGEKYLTEVADPETWLLLFSIGKKTEMIKQPCLFHKGRRTALIGLLFAGM